ncbi:17164_t:CDS:2 [Cetraspora pellucida]|uniref:non-specific serine/threonine protein kinase n=1 Tax=Cetraspora pellucida TaxID=1433469 RepID=A0A9N9E1I0_9GLOM|nr:17164_t:CDS:2 [Cetraspora pellucida]
MSLDNILDNIVNTVQGLSEEPNKLSENEEANLYAYLIDKYTELAGVEKLLNLCKTNTAKLVYLKALSKKSVSGNVSDITSLKREFEKIVKEEVRDLRHEVKRIRLHSEIMWFSAPVTTTETDKGNFVKKYGTPLNFPFKLTTTTRRIEHGKFRNPPNIEVPENILQEYFINECRALQSLKDSVLMVEDSHSIPFLATRKPDFVFIPKGCPLDALHVVAVGEIKKRISNEFTSAAIGHAVSFGEKVLQLQPRRAYVYVVLTDCRLICIYKVTRKNVNASDNARFSYEYTLPKPLKYDSKDCPPAGWKYLVTIMESSQNQLGWIDPSLKFGSDVVNLVRSINTGRTSIVYEGNINDKDSVAVKLIKGEEYLSCFSKEKEVLNEFSSLNSPHLQKLLLGDEGALVTTPLGKKVNNLKKEDIKNIINTLKTVHSDFNRVHMDLRRYNFLRDNNGNIVIIDWGYSVKINETGNFAGALEVMPDDILTSLTNEKQITYLPRIDLICLIRAFYLMLHKPTNAEMIRIAFDGAPDIKSRAQNILTFWSYHGKSDLWKKIYQQASELNYDNLIEELEALF